MFGSQAISPGKNQTTLSHQSEDISVKTHTLSNPKNGEIIHGRLGVTKVTVAYDLGRIYIAGRNGVSILQLNPGTSRYEPLPKESLSSVDATSIRSTNSKHLVY